MRIVVFLCIFVLAFTAFQFKVFAADSKDAWLTDSVSFKEWSKNAEKNLTLFDELEPARICGYLPVHVAEAMELIKEMSRAFLNKDAESVLNKARQIADISDQVPTMCSKEKQYHKELRIRIPVNEIDVLQIAASEVYHIIYLCKDYTDDERLKIAKEIINWEKHDWRFAYICCKMFENENKVKEALALYNYSCEHCQCLEDCPNISFLKKGQIINMLRLDKIENINEIISNELDKKFDEKKQNENHENLIRAIDLMKNTLNNCNSSDNLMEFILITVEYINCSTEYYNAFLNFLKDFVISCAEYSEKEKTSILEEINDAINYPVVLPETVLPENPSGQSE